MLEVSQQRPQISDAVAGDWISLFDGKTLEGWKSVPEDTDWKVENGVIVGSGQESLLFYVKEEFDDFELRAECRVDQRSNSGIFLRSQAIPKYFNNGYEVQLGSVYAPDRTGGIYHLAPFKKKIVEDDTWFKIHVVAVGNHLVVSINDEVTTDYVDEDQRFRRGYVALQQHFKRNSTVRFRNLQLRPLRASGSLARKSATGGPQASVQRFDDLKHTDIRPHELAVAGRGDAQQAPAELVGVIGDSRFKTSEVAKIAYSRDGNRIASLSINGTAVVWNAKTGELLQTFVVPVSDGWYQLHDIEFSADDKYLITNMSQSPSPVVWDVATGEPVRFLSGKVSRSMALSRDGKYIAYKPGVSKLVISEFATGKQVQVLPTTRKRHHECMAFSLDGKKLVSGNDAGDVTIWDTTTGRELHVVNNHKGSIVGVAFSPDGSLVAACGIQDLTVNVWRVETGELVRAFEGPNDYMDAIAFSPDGKFLVTCGGSNMLLLLTDKWSQAKYHLYGPITDFAFNPDGTQIAHGELTGIGVLETATGRRVRGPLNFGKISDVHFNAQGDLILSGWSRDTEQSFVVWRNGVSQQPHFCQPSAYGERSRANATRAAVVYDNLLRVWDIDTSAVLFNRPWSYSDHRTVALDLDGRFVSVGHKDGTIELFDLEANAKVGSVQGHESTAQQLLFTSDGKIVSSAKDGMIKVWNTKLDEPIHQIEHGPVASLSVSRDGTHLSVTAKPSVDGEEDESREIHIYSLASGMLQCTPRTSIRASTNGTER